ncbi:MAG: TadE/TadG family type IV pilus assembly protein [Actinomycetota bacterium]
MDVWRRFLRGIQSPRPSRVGCDECVQLRRRRAGSGERGASAVEFALILPILILLVFGIIQFSIAYNRTQGLQAAAREGARLASIGASYAEIQNRVRASQSLFTATDVVVKAGANGGLPTQTWTVPPCQTAGVGGTVEVRVEVPPPSDDLDKYAITIPLWGNRRITYTASGTFRCERARS